MRLRPVELREADVVADRDPEPQPGQVDDHGVGAFQLAIDFRRKARTTLDVAVPPHVVPRSADAAEGDGWLMDPVDRSFYRVVARECRIWNDLARERRKKGPPFPPGDTVYDYKVLAPREGSNPAMQEVLLVATRASTAPGRAVSR